MNKRILIPVGLLLLTGCHKGDSDESVSIDSVPISVEKPGAATPAVRFPRDCQTEDITLNKFIEGALETCATGDYDQFRLLFSSAFNPPNKADFENIWKNVKSVEIISVHADRREPPNYYVHAVVQLRQADARQRTRRDAVVTVFKEEGHWRLADAPKEVVHKILLVDSQPASDSPDKPTSRPTGGPRRFEGGARTTSRPAPAPGV